MGGNDKGKGRKGRQAPPSPSPFPIRYATGSREPFAASGTLGDLTWLEDFLTSKWPGSFTALAPPLIGPNYRLLCCLFVEFFLAAAVSGTFADKTGVAMSTTRMRVLLINKSAYRPTVTSITSVQFACCEQNLSFTAVHEADMKLFIFMTAECLASEQCLSI